MSQQPPDWFPTDDPAAREEMERRKAHLLEELPRLLKERTARPRGDDRKPGRANSFMPYLLVRSVLGDRGDRPFNTCFWESPDIWTAEGDPDSAPAVPPDHGGQVTAGKPATVYAHVWNLGLAPLAGIKVEFYWFDPSVAIDGSHANLIGIARCDLSARGMAGSHALVKCPRAWVPTMANGGHECLMVRASGIGDPIGGNEWQPWKNRHVGQRNISVVNAGTNFSALLGALDKSRFAEAKLQLLQIGPREGALAARIAAPRLRVSALDTHVLGEIGIDGSVRAARLNGIASGMLAPVHPLAHGGPPAGPVLRPTPRRIVDPLESMPGLRDLHPLERGRGPLAFGRNAHLQRLLAGVRDLHIGVDVQDRPSPGEAHVIRVASYQGDQLIGGYTMVVTA